MNLYRVKVDLSTLDADKTKNGYLAAFGSITYYTRGQALKKARMFGGKIEPVVNPLLAGIRTVTMTQIPRSAISAGVLKALRGNEAFIDTDDELNETIYTGDIFSRIIQANVAIEGSPLAISDEAVLEELNMLNQITTEYLQIIAE
jgi:hypothetical protein